MVESDTVKLLRECDAGVKMGAASIDDVLPYAKAEGLRRVLKTCKDGHMQLQDQIQVQLDRLQDEGKNPNPVAKSMSWMKTGMKMALRESDHTIADLMTEGANMGVKSLSRYLNQYPAADREAKAIAKELIRQEENMVIGVRGYL